MIKLYSKINCGLGPLVWVDFALPPINTDGMFLSCYEQQSFSSKVDA